eukprot:351038_1
MIIGVVGGGNSAHILVNLFTRQNIKTILITRRPNEWDTNGITMYYGNNKTKTREIYTGSKYIVSNDYKLMSEADVIFLCCPISVQMLLLSKIKPFVKPTVLIGTVFGQARFDKMVEYVLGNHIACFAFIQIPWICRTVKYGEIVDNTGDQISDLAFRKQDEEFLKQCDMSWIDHIYTDKSIYVRKVSFIKEWFFPSNNVMHPGICYGRHLTQSNSDYFYHNVSHISGACIDQLDAERLNVIYELNTRFHLNINDKSIVKIWNVWKPTPGNTMYECIGNEPRLQPIKVPKDIHYNAKHRFFTDDIPYGLCYIKYIAELLNIETPFTDRVISWAQNIMNVKYIDEKNGNKLITENLPKYYTERNHIPDVLSQRKYSDTLMEIDNLLNKLET